MVKRYIALSLALLAATASADETLSQDNNTTVFPEVTTPITLSNRDVNRVVCEAGNVEDVFYSEEKGITVATEKKNAFIKFSIQQSDNYQRYITAESEFHIVCGGEVYTLIATPKNSHAKTIRLVPSGRDRIKANIAQYGDLPLERRAADITLKILKGEEPFHFTRRPPDTAGGTLHIPQPNGANVPVTVTPVYNYQVDGIGLSLSTFEVTAKTDVQLHETHFVHPSIGKNIIAVTVEPLDLKAGKTAKAYIVKRGAAL